MSMKAPEAAAPAKDGRPSLWPLMRSLLINLAAPYLVYKLTAGWFPKDSPIPLLICALIPALEMANEFLRRRVLDVISVVSLVQWGLSVVISLVAHSAFAAIIGHALQPAGLGLVYAISLLIGRPLMKALARQTLAGDDPVRQARFDEGAKSPGARRAFAQITAVWTITLCLESVALIFMAYHLSTSTYLLVANIATTAVLVALSWGSVSWGRRQGRTYAEK
jgi:hypothetical protein